MSRSILYPWLRSPLNSLWERYRQKRLPHALLVSGPKGGGKRALAQIFSQQLLCSQSPPEGTACGHCRSCQLLAAGTHPDYYSVVPEEEGKGIKIDQIRQLCATLAQSSQFGGYKIAVIEPAELMTEQAANSLLKTLEEPTSNTVILLLSSRPAQLPITIVSRCQKLLLLSPKEAEAADWLSAQGQNSQQVTLALALSNGSPLAALELLSDDRLAERRQRLPSYLALLQGREEPVRLAQRWADPALAAVVVNELRSWVSDIIRIRMVAGIRIENRDCQPDLIALADALDLKTLYLLHDRLCAAFRPGESSLNSQIVLEDLLIGAANVRVRVS